MSMQDALEYCHGHGYDLYEDTPDGPNLLYAQRWDRHQRRATWLALRASVGHRTTGRKNIPTELKEGTRGRNFEVQ